MYILIYFLCNDSDDEVDLGRAPSSAQWRDRRGGKVSEAQNGKTLKDQRSAVWFIHVIIPAIIFYYLLYYN